jgi:hypothetical protein
MQNRFDVKRSVFTDERYPVYEIRDVREIEVFDAQTVTVQNAVVGKQYPSAPGLTPAQSANIFKTVDYSSGGVNSKPPVIEKKCPVDDVCSEGGRRSRKVWCNDCNKII